MQIVHTVTEASAQSDQLFNAAHVYSSLNRKMIAPVDNAGIAQAFALNIKVYSDGANKATFETASNSYVTKQSIKSWYKVWRKKITDSGVSMKDLGPYGRVFKPRLVQTPDNLGSGPEVGRGEWNYSDIVTVPAVEGGAESTGGGGLENNDLADQYTLSICGATVLGSSGEESRKFVNVGMIQSWLGSRKSYPGAESNTDVSESLVFNTNNPLLLARGGNTASELLLDEVRDLQKDEPPYDGQDFVNPYTQAIVRSNADLYGECDIIAPCGLVQVTTTAACTMVFTLVGIGDM